ncbi:hypothetical protein B0H14DRAFT_3635386 [Mycena olivaceomarginata]|nr:hypothetical protein B0H14DRAFT_3635386 [Mycena olivaceomarginata]
MYYIITKKQFLPVVVSQSANKYVRKTQCRPSAAKCGYISGINQNQAPAYIAPCPKSHPFDFDLGWDFTSLQLIIFSRSRTYNFCTVQWERTLWKKFECAHNLKPAPNGDSSLSTPPHPHPCLVDFDRMGKVGLAGAFAGSFSSIAGTPATNIASYTPSSAAFAALGSNDPNGEIETSFDSDDLLNAPHWRFRVERKRPSRESEHRNPSRTSPAWRWHRSWVASVWDWRMIPRTAEQVNNRQATSPAAIADADDSRLVSSPVTSHVRMRSWKQPARMAMWSEHLRQRFAAALVERNTGDIPWFPEGGLNTVYNCVDQWALTHLDRVAIIYEADDPGAGSLITYGELLREVCSLVNVLCTTFGVKRGDTMSIYLPMTLHAAAAFRCAIHSVVSAGFSAESLCDHVNDCASRVLITSDEGRQARKAIVTKAIVDATLKECPGVEHCLVLKRTGAGGGRVDGVEGSVPSYCAPEIMATEDPLFILYTSGSTGKSKGVVHTMGRLLLCATLTVKYVFDVHEGDRFACMADVG